MLWDAATGRRDGVVGDHGAEVLSVAFGSKGRVIASGGRDGAITLWDVDGGQPRRIADQGGAVTTLDFSPDPGFDGQLLASGSRDGSVVLWRITPEDAIPQRLTPHTDGVTSVAFSLDGQLVASGGDDYMVRLWDAASGEPSATQLARPRHPHRVTRVAFSPDGTTLAVATQGGRVSRWDIATGEPSGADLHAEEPIWVTSLAFSADGRRLASGATDQRVLLWDADGRRWLDDGLGPADGGVTDVAFGAGGRFLAVAGERGTIVLWDLDLASWKTHACRLAGRNLDAEERQKYLGDERAGSACPDLPAG